VRCFLIGAAGAGESVRPRRLCRPLWESPDALCSTCVRPGTSAGPSTSPLDAMKCFTHQAVDAIGTCKSCGKGLCPGCAVDLHFALSCRGDCESELSAVRTQILRSRKLLETQARFRFFAPLSLACAAPSLSAVTCGRGTFLGLRLVLEFSLSCLALGFTWRPDVGRASRHFMTSNNRWRGP